MNVLHSLPNGQSVVVSLSDDEIKEAYWKLIDGDICTGIRSELMDAISPGFLGSQPPEIRDHMLNIINSVAALGVCRFRVTGWAVNSKRSFAELIIRALEEVI